MLDALKKALVRLWVKPTVLPKSNLIEQLKGRNVCYVLHSDAAAKMVVLEKVCEQHGLPLPSAGVQGHQLNEKEAVFALENLKAKQADPAPAKLARLIESAKHQEQEILIVPVSIFWGRAPKNIDSVIQSFFTDEGVRSGRMSRFLAFVFNGRKTMVHLGEPVELNRWVTSDTKTSFLTRKLTRILRVHFARRRLASIGPDQPHPQQLAQKIIKTDLVNKVIEREVSRNKMSRVEAEQLAKDYALEIAAVINMRFALLLEKLLSWLWNKLYDGIVLHHFARVDRLSREHQIVYVPSHQSHMDYLVLSYALFNEGLAPPHVAAGLNLNFPIVGPWLRRCGAFFLRRSFKGNALYGAVFEAYMGHLAEKGTAVEYFVEGGRSRTGRKLKAKPGLLAMSVRGFLRDKRRSIVFLPVNFAYEKLVEGETYIKELSGKPKKDESVFGVLRSIKALKSHFGRVHVNFGEPIYLDKLLSEIDPQWRAPNSAENKALVTRTVDLLGERIMAGINDATHVNAIGLLAHIMLSTTDHRLDKTSLIDQLNLYLKLLKEMPYTAEITVVESSAEEIVEYGLAFGAIATVDGGKAIVLDKDQAVLLTYFRNNIAHLLTLPSFVAACFMCTQTLKRQQVSHWFHLVYPFLKTELSLHWRGRQTYYAANAMTTFFKEEGFLREEKNQLMLDDEKAKKFELLSRGVVLSLERYYLTLTILKQVGVGELSRAELEKRCINAAKALSALKELNSPEFFHKDLFKGFIEQLFAQKIIWADEKGKITFDDQVNDIIDDAGLVMSKAVRSNIHQVIPSLG